MAKGYTTQAGLAAFLGRPLTTTEQAQADAAIAATEAYIDRVTGRSWMDPTPTLGESYPVFGPKLYLKRRPVLTVTALRVACCPTETQQPLTVDQFTLVDAARGLVWVSAYTGYAWVDYTHQGPPLPADLAYAANLLATAWTGAGGATADGLGGDVVSYMVGQELTVTRGDRIAASAGLPVGAAPPEVDAILAGYARAGKVFA